VRTRRQWAVAEDVEDTAEERLPNCGERCPTNRRVGQLNEVGEILNQHFGPRSELGKCFDTSRVEIQWRWDLYVRAGDAEWDDMTDAGKAEAWREEHGALVG